MPLLEEAGTILQLVMLPEAAEVHLPWLRTRLADYGADVRARLLAGLLLPSTAYVTGLRARRWFRDELDRVLRALRPARGARDAGRARRRSATTRSSSRRADPVPAGADPLQLAVEPRRAAGRERARAASSTACRSASRSSAAAFERADGASRPPHAFQRATDWHERRSASPSPFDGARQTVVYNSALGSKGV